MRRQNVTLNYICNSTKTINGQIKYYYNFSNFRNQSDYNYMQYSPEFSTESLKCIQILW